jgi:hypothetical protein
MSDSDGFGAYDAEANRFAYTVACGPPEEGYLQRNRRGTGPRRAVVTRMAKAVTVLWF